MDKEQELIELASQLKTPSGAKGIEIADYMNEGNRRMTLQSIDNLNIRDNDKILELGHGNCGHLAYLFQQNNSVTYYGLEISELMHQEAQRINQDYLEKRKAFFTLYDGQNIPFEDNFFDKIFTVNTVYFWRDPAALLKELYRVLKSGGILNITFGQKTFMERLPFTKFGFELYDNARITALIEPTAFKLLAFNTDSEDVKTPGGDIMKREFTTASLQK